MQDIEGGGVELALTSGLSPGAKLRENRLFKIGTLGISFQGELSLEQWRELLKGWKQVRQTWFTGLADLINYGKARFGADKVQEALAQLEFDLADEAKALAIGQLPLALRSSNLTEEHYYVLGKYLDDDEARGKWVTVAVENKLSAYELQRSIEAGSILSGASMREQQGRNSGLLTIQAISLRFKTWEKDIGGEEKILTMPEDSKRALVEELKAPGELYLKLKSQIGQAA